MLLTPEPDELLALLKKPVADLLPLECIKLFAYLQNLVPLWLQPAAVRRIEEEILSSFDRPQLPQDRGSCWIVMALQAPEAYPLHRPAFVLPLQWQR